MANYGSRTKNQNVLNNLDILEFKTNSAKSTLVEDYFFHLGGKLSSKQAQTL